MKTMKKMLAIFLATIMALGVMSVSVFAEEESADKVVNFVGITLELPEDGMYPSGYHALDSEAYELVDFTWTDVEANEVIFSSLADSLIEEKPFVEGKVYTVTVTLYADSDYVFESNTDELIVSINGYVANVKEVNLADKRLVATCDFECNADIFDVGGDGSTGVTFDQILSVLKTALVTFIRFIGALLGIK